MENCSHRTFIRIRTDNELHDRFKEYCISKDTTMSKVLIDYITTLVGNAGKAPAKEKNSGERTGLVKLYHCPYCGKDITDMGDADKLNHLQNCKNGRKE